MTPEQKSYMLACSDMAAHLERAAVSGWSIKKLMDEWAAHMARTIREYDNVVTQDNPSEYISVLEMQEIRKSTESDKGKGEFEGRHCLCDSTTE